MTTEKTYQEIEQDENCPGCGAAPGDDLNEDCNHPEGCGFYRDLTPEWYQEDEDVFENCPGCGVVPGNGLTEGCNHPDGCGFYQ